MSAADDLAIYRNLRGTVCACGVTKKARQSFCRLHYFGLPKGTQEALYDIDGYADTYRRACGLLGLTVPDQAAVNTLSKTNQTSA